MTLLELSAALLPAYAPEHRTLCLMPTFQCTAKCRHCGTVSSPAEPTWLDESLLREAVREVAGKYRHVVFSGGEPTLAGELLLDAMRQARALGLGVGMVTNAHWADTEAAAASAVRSYREAGLEEITLSTGDEHARFVPLDHIMRAARACLDEGIGVTIVVESTRDSRITPALVQVFQARVLRWIWSPVSAFGKQKYCDGDTINRSNLQQCTGCEEVLSTTTVQADGEISPCCGLGIRFVPELRMGNIRDTTLEQADRRASGDFLKRWIHVEGPERILAWAAEHDPSIEWENRYAHRCQACIRLYKDEKVRRVIAEHYEEKIASVDAAEADLYPGETGRKIQWLPGMWIRG